MRKIYILLLTLSIFICEIQAQLGVLKGKIIPADDCHDQLILYLPFSTIELWDSLNMPIITTQLTDNYDYSINNIPSGTYSVALLINGCLTLIINNIAIYSNDSIKVNLINPSFPPPCQETPINNSCPYCNSSRKVLQTAPEVIVTYAFRNERKANKAYKRIQKRGYNTFRPGSPYPSDEQLPERVHDVFIDGEDEKFRTGCYKWFCTRCKKVF